MLTYPDINPIALSIGPLKVHWYGLMYLIGFAAALWLANLRTKKAGAIFTSEQVSDLIFYGAMGVVVGGRFGYVIFYHFDYFLQNPLWLFSIWEFNIGGGNWEDRGSLTPSLLSFPLE